MVTMALTGRKLRCYEVLDAWREAVKARWRFSTRCLPKALKDAVLHCREITEMHSARKPLPLEFYLRKNKTSFFAEKIREAWGRAHRSVPCEMQLQVGGFPKISPCFVQKVRGSTVFTYPKFSWCTKVYKRGLAVVDGFLVTEIVKENRDLILAKILTYSIRKNVRFCEPLAVLQKDDTGKWFVASMRNEKTGQFTFGKEVG